MSPNGTTAGRPSMPAAAGFTLVELIIVVALIAVIAAIAVPNLMSSRATTNERAVIATLRTIATAQAQALTQANSDVDRDGQGEYLTLAELAGAVTPRSQPSPLKPAPLSASFGILDSDNHLKTKGYYFALYLPDATGAGINPRPNDVALIDTDLAETNWTCLAWPAILGNTGTAAFFINQHGETMMCTDGRYNGKSRVPPAGAALTGVPPGIIVGGRLALTGTAADGFEWRAAR